MRTLEFGSIRVTLDTEEETVSLLTALMRHLGNKEVAAMIGVSERTVRRWKQEGRLPCRANEPVMLADLLLHLAPGTPRGATSGRKDG